MKTLTELYDSSEQAKAELSENNNIVVQLNGTEEDARGNGDEDDEDYSPAFKPTTNTTDIKIVKSVDKKKKKVTESTEASGFAGKVSNGTKTINKVPKKRRRSKVIPEKS